MADLLQQEEGQSFKIQYNHLRFSLEFLWLLFLLLVTGYRMFLHYLQGRAVFFHIFRIVNISLRDKAFEMDVGKLELL